MYQEVHRAFTRTGQVAGTGAGEVGEGGGFGDEPLVADIHG